LTVIGILVAEAKVLSVVTPTLKDG